MLWLEGEQITGERSKQNAREYLRNRESVTAVFTSTTTSVDPGWALQTAQLDTGSIAHTYGASDASYYTAADLVHRENHTNVNQVHQTAADMARSENRPPEFVLSPRDSHRTCTDIPPAAQQPVSPSIDFSTIIAGLPK